MGRRKNDAAGALVPAVVGGEKKLKDEMSSSDEASSSLDESGSSSMSSLLESSSSSESSLSDDSDSDDWSLCSSSDDDLEQATRGDGKLSRAALKRMTTYVTHQYQFTFGGGAPARSGGSDKVSAVLSKNKSITGAPEDVKVSPSRWKTALKLPDTADMSAPRVVTSAKVTLAYSTFAVPLVATVSGVPEGKTLKNEHASDDSAHTFTILPGKSYDVKPATLYKLKRANVRALALYSGVDLAKEKDQIISRARASGLLDVPRDSIYGTYLAENYRALEAKARALRETPPTFNKSTNEFNVSKTTFDSVHDSIEKAIAENAIATKLPDIKMALTRPDRTPQQLAAAGFSSIADVASATKTAADQHAAGTHTVIANVRYGVLMPAALKEYMAKSRAKVSGKTKKKKSATKKSSTKKKSAGKKKK